MVLLLRSLDHVAAGGVRYTASKISIPHLIEQFKKIQKWASCCSEKNTSSKTPANFWTTSDVFIASEKDKSLAEIRRGTTTDFGVTLSRSTISRHLRTKLKKKSVKKVRTFRLRDISQKKRKAFCEQLLPRL